MADELGTRIKANQSNSRNDQGDITRSFTRDLGMTKNVTANLTFDAALGRITGVAGNFSAFATGDPVFVAGTNLNNGHFFVMGVAGDGSYLAVDPPPKAEGPITATVRTE